MPTLYKKTDRDGKVFCEVNRSKKRGYYLISRDSSQSKFCKKIRLHGFDKLPGGLYTQDGIGLTGAGSFVLETFNKKYGKMVDLTLSQTGKPKMNESGAKIKVTIPLKLLMDLNTSYRATKRVRNDENRTKVKGFLAEHFPKQFGEYKEAVPKYTPGLLADVLNKQGISAALDDEDRKRLEQFIPEYLSGIKGTLRAKGKLNVVIASLDAGRKIYLEKIIAEFKRKLAQKTQNEGIWQDFLSRHILLLRSTYGQVLEKMSVSLQGKFPDFMLIDPYSYLDIYEIKTPSTTLLKLDKSRNNYYWDTEIVKAISQVENYLHQIQKNSDGFVNDIRRSKGIDVSVVRPRGYIVAGTREQLTTTKMRDDFRMLNESLKNIDILLYDDLVSNLEAFVKRFSDSRTHKLAGRKKK